MILNKDINNNKLTIISHNQNICHQPESIRLEFKERFPKGDQVAKTVIAFANGAGGKIIFGVKDSPI